MHTLLKKKTHVTAHANTSLAFLLEESWSLCFHSCWSKNRSGEAHAAKKGVGECCCDPASSSQDRIVERTVSYRKKSLAFRLPPPMGASSDVVNFVAHVREENVEVHFPCSRRQSMYSSTISLEKECVRGAPAPSTTLAAKTSLNDVPGPNLWSSCDRKLFLQIAREDVWVRAAVCR